MYEFTHTRIIMSTFFSLRILHVLNVCNWPPDGALTYYSPQSLITKIQPIRGEHVTWHQQTRVQTHFHSTPHRNQSVIDHKNFYSIFEQLPLTFSPTLQPTHPTFHYASSRPTTLLGMADNNVTKDGELISNKFASGNLYTLYLGRNTEQSKTWRIVSEALLKKPLSLSVLMTKAPRWNTLERQ